MIPGIGIEKESNLLIRSERIRVAFLLFQWNQYKSNGLNKEKKLGHCEIDSMVERNQIDFFLPYYPDYPDFFDRILLIRVRPSYLKLRRP